MEMAEDSEHEKQRFEDPGGEVYDFFRYLYELDPKDSHLAYEAWYELPFEEKAFWAKVLHLEQRLGVSYKGGGVDSSVPQVASDIIELGISAATKVSGPHPRCDALLMFSGEPCWPKRCLLAYVRHESTYHSPKVNGRTFTTTERRWGLDRVRFLS